MRDPQRCGGGRRSLGAALRSLPARQILPPHAIHHVAGGDDRTGRAGAVVGVALFDAIRRDEGDAKIAVHVGADDRLVVARNRPRERLWVLAAADDERPQASRHSWPSTM